MRTVFVNEIWGKDKEVARGFIVVPKTINESMSILFSETKQQFIKAMMSHERIEKEGGFHVIERFCQFVVFLNYNASYIQFLGKPQRIGISIELLNFGTSDDVNDIFNYMLKLRNEGWEEQSRERIIGIGRDIKKDMSEPHFEIADLIVKDPPDKISSYL